jgi:hypothetical protein
METSALNLPSNAPITIQYALKRSEIVRFYFYSVAKSSKYLRMIGLYCAAFIGLHLLVVFSVQRVLSIRDLLFGLLWGAGFLVFLPVWMFIRAKTATRTLAISDAGIATTIGKLATQIPWTKIRVVRDAGPYILVARTNGNAFFIPSRAFVDVDHRIRFLAEMQRLTSAAR